MSPSAVARAAELQAAVINRSRELAAAPTSHVSSKAADGIVVLADALGLFKGNSGGTSLREAVKKHLQPPSAFQADNGGMLLLPNTGQGNSDSGLYTPLCCLPGTPNSEATPAWDGGRKQGGYSFGDARGQFPKPAEFLLCAERSSMPLNLSAVERILETDFRKRKNSNPNFPSSEEPVYGLLVRGDVGSWSFDSDGQALQCSEVFRTFPLTIPVSYLFRHLPPDPLHPPPPSAFADKRAWCGGPRGETVRARLDANR